MKKELKRAVALGLSVATIASMAGCGNQSAASTETKGTTVEKPTTVKIMTDTTVREENGGASFWEQFEKLTGVDVEYIQPDHASYLETVSNRFTSGDYPDMVQLSSDYYVQYALNGFLWDTTDAWENSEIKKSGRLTAKADDVFDALKVYGPEGDKRLYGFSSTTGNGCQTYVKKSWLDACNIPVSEFQDKQLDFNTYYKYLKQMAEKKGHYVISAPGFISKEAPYTNYLPEFYQDAQYTFYEKSEGNWVDGFTEQAMKDAITRIRKGVADGVIDNETVTNTTGTTRDKFESASPETESGIFTYWAGTWQNSLQNNLKNKGYSENTLIAMKPIKELGKYLDRIPTCWAITADAKNPEGVFKYVVEAMFDGGVGQTLWTYGAEDVHWTKKAGSVQLKNSDKVTTFDEGVFHMLPTPNKEETLYTRNCFDPLLLIATFDGGDPGEATTTDVAKKSQAAFNENSKLAYALPSSEAYIENIGDINIAKEYIISQVALGSMTLEDGYAYYEKQVGSKVKDILKSLNK